MQQNIDLYFIGEMSFQNMFAGLEKIKEPLRVP
jgi:hypothetical protein